MLSLEYGFVKTGRALAKDMFGHIVNESIAAVSQCAPWDYDRIFLISKSFGTMVAGEARKRFPDIRIQSLYLTPIPAALPYLSKDSCTVVIGNQDRYFPISLL